MELDRPEKAIPAFEAALKFAKAGSQDELNLNNWISQANKAISERNSAKPSNPDSGTSFPASSGGMPDFSQLLGQLGGMEGLQNVMQNPQFQQMYAPFLSFETLTT